ncbi:MAG TPA: hypothetical protein PLB30_03950 [Thermoleophilia bacterium]|nr:hypothetical protein [Thermoleophilia bacterium]HQG03413.1 hypothetical protein [Thermoleophilia bacterium]HQJ97692.1 hypothetical protein [Thermoleophilia bacterium]
MKQARKAIVRDPEQPVHVACLAPHDADQRVGDEVEPHLVGDAVRQRHERHDEDRQEAGLELAE